MTLNLAFAHHLPINQGAIHQSTISTRRWSRLHRYHSPQPSPSSNASCKKAVPTCIIEAFNHLNIEEISQVATGSFGEVFCGTLQPSNTPVILKRARTSKTARNLFAVEKKINRKLSISGDTHIPRWPKYLGGYVKDSQFFIVWQRDNDGLTLQHYLSGKHPSSLCSAFNLPHITSAPLRISLFANLLTSLLLAIRDIHNMGVVHRDIKPDNLLIVPSSINDTKTSNTVRLIDFGSACEVGTVLWSRGIDTLDPLWAAPETRVSLLAPKKFDVFSAALVGVSVIIPSFSSETRLIEFRQRLERVDFDLRRYRQQWLDESGRDGKAYGSKGSEAELAALFSSDNEISKDVFNLLCAMLKKSPVDRISVDAALNALSRLTYKVYAY